MKLYGFFNFCILCYFNSFSFFMIFVEKSLLEKLEFFVSIQKMSEFIHASFEELMKRIWFKIETFIASCLCKCLSLCTIWLENEKKNIYFLICSIEKQFEKHSDIIAKTSRAMLNENKNVQLSSFFIIFWHFLIVQVTVDLGTQIFPGHFETTILHHFCRTSRETTSVFHVNVNLIHTHQLSVGGKPSTMVTAEETCKAGHLRAWSLCAKFV